MYIIHSTDGTEIACRDAGQGSPVLMVHGIAANGARWEPLLPMLKPRFQIYMMDRRGHGASGDTAPYAIEREFEDVAAVANSIDRPIAIVGQGFGAVAALEAAQRSANVRKLVLFEPTVRSGGVEFYPDGAIDRIEHLLAQERREEAVTYLLREVFQVTLDELEEMQRQVVWQRRLDAAPTIPREMRAQAGYVFDPSRFRGMNIPTLVIVGARSVGTVQRQAEMVTDTLRGASKVELPGQGYAAIDASPGVFVREVVEYLRDTW